MPTLHSHKITHGLFIFKGVREPHAVCQVAPGEPQAKPWQRVCLFQRTTTFANQIDQLVYQLYDLTEEEIKIVEGR